MAKKNMDATPPPAPPQIQEPNLERGDDEPGYTVGLWAGHQQYVCKQCAFDALELGVMEEHLMLAHGSFRFQEPVAIPPSPLAPLPQGEGDEMADGIYEIDLKEDQ